MPEFNKDFYAARSKELLDTLTEAKGCTHSCPCTHCGKKDTRAKRCTSCKFEKYCNVDCQKADWKLRVLCACKDDLDDLYCKQVIILCWLKRFKGIVTYLSNIMLVLTNYHYRKQWAFLESIRASVDADQVSLNSIYIPLEEARGHFTYGTHDVGDRTARIFTFLYVWITALFVFVVALLGPVLSRGFILVFLFLVVASTSCVAGWPK